MAVDAAVEPTTLPQTSIRLRSRKKTIPHLLLPSVTGFERSAAAPNSVPYFYTLWWQWPGLPHSEILVYAHIGGERVAGVSQCSTLVRTLL